MFARDPRIPDELEAISLQLEAGPKVAKTEWYIDNELIAQTGEDILKTNWPLIEGSHFFRALVWYQNEDRPQTTESVNFVVN